MASKFLSERNLRFLLYEVFDVVSLTRYDDYNSTFAKFQDHFEIIMVFWLICIT